MTIQKRLFQISCLVIFFVVLVVFGLIQCSKGARFHQLHILHNKYTSELMAYIPLSSENAMYDIQAIHNLLQEIRKQPVACLELINWLDRSVMEALDTDYAITLCEDDIIVVDYALAALDKFQQQEITSDDIYAVLTQTMEVFSDHSNRFEKPITKTVNFVFTLTLLFFIVLSIVISALVTYAVCGIAKSVKKMRETSSALRASEKRNRQLANFDSLTGMPNRNLFLDRLNYLFEMARQRERQLALLFVDLDHFKNVNDSMGHYAGDQLICMASTRIASCIGEEEVLARIGGDEFNIIASENATVENSEIIAKKILQAFSKPFDVMGETVFMSASIGIALYPEAADNPDDLKKCADLAMHKAKEQGRNTYIFYSLILEYEIKQKMVKEQCLRQALVKNEFSLHFQPVISLHTMKTVSVEALLRWNSEELGFVPPDEFISIAEETGLIVEIGDWVLQEACKKASVWREKDNPDLKIAVNVSPRQLLSPHFVASVNNALNMSQLPPEALDMEITENIFIEEGGAIIATLEEISSMGINLFLDDFGTGHSSLSCLHKLPIDVLKIDRSFVMKLDDPSENTNIIPSIVAMSHELNLYVVAEGVETQESLHALKKLQCEYAQGYFIGRPVPAEELDVGKDYKDIA